MFNHVVCGGTFDHLHAGHRKLLDTCVRSGKKLTVGITSDAMISAKAYAYAIESYTTRRIHLRRHLPKGVQVIKLNGIFGSTLTDESIDAIGVTDETMQGALRINKEREKIGMKPLYIINVDFVQADDGTKISSERIRKGEISSEGISYYNYLISKEIRYLPNSLVRHLRMPLGRVFSTMSDGVRVIGQLRRGKEVIQLQKNNILVGDIVTAEFKKLGYKPYFSVIDTTTQRQALNNTFLSEIIEKDHCNAPNEKGTLDKRAIEMIRANFNLKPHEATKQVIITGEEDLLVLPIVLLAPLDWYVWYGMRGRGVVVVRVTEKKKEAVYNLIQQFT